MYLLLLCAIDAGSVTTNILKEVYPRVMPFQLNQKVCGLRGCLGSDVRYNVSKASKRNIRYLRNVSIFFNDIWKELCSLLKSRLRDSLIMAWIIQATMTFSHCPFSSLRRVDRCK